jgi:methyltransferase (TIGR00027 family)
VVLLGAGLDLMFYENGFDAAPLFEMDCMPTQSWKRTRLDQLKVSTSHVTFVECDLEVDDLASCLERKGFDPARKTIYVWLGVVSYLKRETVEKVLAQMQNAVVIFDYSEPPSRDKQFEKRAKHVAELGEVGF